MDGNVEDKKYKENDMLVTLVFDEGIRSIVLPEKISGKYWMKDLFGNSIISIEGIDEA